MVSFSVNLVVMILLVLIVILMLYARSDCPNTRYIYREYVSKKKPIVVSEFYNKLFTQDNIIN
jgi:uncharacterized membrane protein